MDLDSIEKFDVEELIKEFRILNLANFDAYLKQIWKDLALRSGDLTRGISKLTFSKYYDLPGIIGDRFFSVLDDNKDGFLDCIEFIEGMTSLFYDPFENLTKFVFKIYDFNRDNMISKEDVKVVLSYVTIKSEKYKFLKLRFEREEFKDRIESQIELHSIIEKTFLKKNLLDFNGYLDAIKNNCSESFLYILIFILEKKPFSNESANNYQIKKRLSDQVLVSKTPQISSKIFIASPSLFSKFSPAVTISKTSSLPQKDSNTVFKSTLDTKIILDKLINNNQPNLLLKYAGKAEKDESKNVTKKRNSKFYEEGKTIFDEIELAPANKLYISMEENSDEEVKRIKHEGYLYKLKKNKHLKKLWFKLVYKDLYYYKNKDDTIHKGMKNLSGVYVNDDISIVQEGVNFYCFSAVFSNKIRYYYSESKEECHEWVNIIRKVNEYSNLIDLYYIKEKIGNGKFGIVRLGIHKETGRNVAIKILNKKEMSPQDLQRIKSEIDILKVCQHPNIIRLYDVFENVQFYYIIMEYCAGGDLFTYIEDRGFKLTEKKVAEIIHKLSAAVYYIHSYGIVHRDLKPENILLTDDSDDADIRLLDFGLSKIIGPNEKCNESLGTISYVAPEVLLEKPYGKNADLWTIGVITYLLLVGALPFDDESFCEREIARQTIYDPVPFSDSLFSNISEEAIQFVDNLLQKDPEMRMSIKEVLDHPWINKYCNSSFTEFRKKNSDKECNFIFYTTTDNSI